MKGVYLFCEKGKALVTSWEGDNDAAIKRIEREVLVAEATTH
jgi:hypothetical protein